MSRSLKSARSRLPEGIFEVTYPLNVEAIFGTTDPELVLEGPESAKTMTFVRAVLQALVRRQSGRIHDSGSVSAMFLHDDAEGLFCYGAAHRDPRLVGRVFARARLSDWNAFVRFLIEAVPCRLPILPNRVFPHVHECVELTNTPWRVARCTVACAPTDTVEVMSNVFAIRESPIPVLYV